MRVPAAVFPAISFLPILFLPILFLPILDIALLGAGRPSRQKKWLGLLLLGTVLAGMVTLPACGGSSGGGSGPTGTPPGTYNIIVTGTAGSTSHSVPFALTLN